MEFEHAVHWLSFRGGVLLLERGVYDKIREYLNVLKLPQKIEHGKRSVAIELLPKYSTSESPIYAINIKDVILQCFVPAEKRITDEKKISPEISYEDVRFSVFQIMTVTSEKTKLPKNALFIAFKSQMKDVLNTIIHGHNKKIRCSKTKYLLLFDMIEPTAFKFTYLLSNNGVLVLPFNIYSGFERKIVLKLLNTYDPIEIVTEFSLFPKYILRYRVSENNKITRIDELEVSLPEYLILMSIVERVEELYRDIIVEKPYFIRNIHGNIVDMVSSVFNGNIPLLAVSKITTMLHIDYDIYHGVNVKLDREILYGILRHQREYFTELLSKEEKPIVRRRYKI